VASTGRICRLALPRRLLQKRRAPLWIWPITRVRRRKMPARPFTLASNLSARFGTPASRMNEWADRCRCVKRYLISCFAEWNFPGSYCRGGCSAKPIILRPPAVRRAVEPFVEPVSV
jgi:hypothetical protein